MTAFNALEPAGSEDLFTLAKDALPVVMEAKAISMLAVADGDNRFLGVVHMRDLLGKGGILIAGR